MKQSQLGLLYIVTLIFPGTAFLRRQESKKKLDSGLSPDERVYVVLEN
jgi:hypothetical protein